MLGSAQDLGRMKKMMVDDEEGAIMMEIKLDDLFAGIGDGSW